MNTVLPLESLSPSLCPEIILGDITLDRLAIIDQPTLKFYLEAAAP